MASAFCCLSVWSTAHCTCLAACRAFFVAVGLIMLAIIVPSEATEFRMVLFRSVSTASAALAGCSLPPEAVFGLQGTADCGTKPVGQAAPCHCHG